MSFDVWLVSSDDPMAADDAVSATARGLAAIGASQHGHEIQLRDGRWITFHSSQPEKGGMFVFRAIDQEIAEVVYALAEATNCFVVLSEAPLLRTPSNKAAPPDGMGADFSPVDLPSVDDLLERLEKRFLEWSDYRDEVIGAAPKRSLLSALRRLFFGS